MFNVQGWEEHAGARVRGGEESEFNASLPRPSSISVQIGLNGCLQIIKEELDKAELGYFLSLLDESGLAEVGAVRSGALDEDLRPVIDVVAVGDEGIASGIESPVGRIAHLIRRPKN